MKIKELQEFMLSLSASERADFAKRCGTTLGMIKQIYYGNRKCNPALAIEIDKCSKGAVKCDILSPQTDFDYIRKTATQNDKTP